MAPISLKPYNIMEVSSTTSSMEKVQKEPEFKSTLSKESIKTVKKNQVLCNGETKTLSTFTKDNSTMTANSQEKVFL